MTWGGSATFYPMMLALPRTASFLPGISWPMLCYFSPEVFPQYITATNRVLRAREETWRRVRICLDQRCPSTRRKSESAAEMDQRKHLTKIIHFFVRSAK